MAVDEKQSKEPSSAARITIALNAQEELLDTNKSLLNSLGSSLERVLEPTEIIEEDKLAQVELPIMQVQVGEAIERNNRRIDVLNKQIGFLIDHLEI